MEEDWRVFGCDTEFVGWDPVEGSMVGRGKVVCLSIYSPMGLKVEGVEGKVKHVWVDVDGEADGTWNSSGRDGCGKWGLRDNSI